MTTGSELCIFIFFCTVSLISSEGLGRGFGDSIDWVTYDDGLKISKESNKPLMLVIHKSWCGACKALKPKFSGSTAIRDLSSNFVMVNTEDDEEPKGSQFTPDGGYIPRIFFLSPSGEVQTQIKNKSGNPKYGYYYSDPSQIIPSMKEAMKLFSTTNYDEL